MGKHDIAVNKINSKEVGANIIAQNKLTYEESYNAIDFDVDDLVNKQAVLDLISTVGITSQEVTKIATTVLPLTLLNGVDFTTGSKTPIVGIKVKKDATTKTSNGADFNVELNYTDSSMNTLLSITVDNGFGSLEFDTTFTIV